MVHSLLLANCRAVLLAVGILTVVPAAVFAQPVRRDTIVYWADPAIATLMLVDALPAPAASDARAVVIRRHDGLPRNIILVTTVTAPRDLAAAVTALAFSRRSRGDQVDREMRTVIRASADGARSQATDDRLAEQDLRRLRLAPDFSIASLGVRGPAITVRMSDSAVVRPRGSPSPGARPPGA